MTQILNLDELIQLLSFEEGQRDIADKLDELIQLHEKQHGPTLPTSEEPGWQACRFLLDGITCISDNVPERKEDCEDKW